MTRLYTALVENNFTLIYVKRGESRFGESAEFRLQGALLTDEDRKKAAKFIGKVVKDPALVSNFKFIDSVGSDRGKPFSSAILHDEWDRLITPPEGYDDGWVKD